MKNIGVIITSHGLFAQEALKTVEMIIGYEIDNCQIVSVLPGMQSEECLAEMHAKKEILNCENGCIILTDIYGGTPANTATYLAIEDTNTIVFAGVNIPILLELLLSNVSNLEQAQALLDAKALKSIINVTKILRGGNQDGN